MPKLKEVTIAARKSHNYQTYEYSEVWDAEDLPLDTMDEWVKERQAVARATVTAELLRDINESKSQKEIENSQNSKSQFLGKNFPQQAVPNFPAPNGHRATASGIKPRPGGAGDAQIQQPRMNLTM